MFLHTLCIYTIQCNELKVSRNTYVIYGCNINQNAEFLFLSIEYSKKLQLDLFKFRFHAPQVVNHTPTPK